MTDEERKESATEHWRRGRQLAWYQRPRKPRSALKEFRKALELNPDMPDPHLDIGHIYFFLGKPRYVEAEGEVREAVRLSPGWSEAYGFLGNVLDAQERPTEALAAFREACRLAPDDARWWVNLGALLLKQGQPSEAVEALVKGLAIEHLGKVSSRWFLAEAYFQDGQLERAMEEWKRIVASDFAWDYEKWSVRDAKRKLKEHSPIC